MSDKAKKFLMELLYGENPPTFPEEGVGIPREDDFPVGPVQLRIESWSSTALTIVVTGYTTREYINERHTTNSDRSRAESNFNLDNPLKVLQITPPNGTTVKRGQCYVRASLIVGGLPARIYSTGYLTDSKTITFPPGVFEGSTEGRGYIYLYAASNPAAGNEIIVDVPTNATWRVMGLNCQFVTDATVTNRGVKLFFLSPAFNIFFVPDFITHPASTSHLYCWGIDYGLGFQGTVDSEHVSIGIPSLILPQGSRMETRTENIQSNDDWGVPYIWVEEWIEE